VNSKKIEKKIKKNQIFQGIRVLTVVVCFLTAGLAYGAFEEIISTGARSQGMGEAFVALSNNADALFINPAGLMDIKKIQISTTLSFPYTFLENDMLKNGFISAAIPLMEYNAIGLGWNGFITDFYTENVFAFSYAHKLADNFTLAGTLKLLSWDSARSNFYTDGLVDFEDLNSPLLVSFDVGTLYKPSQEVSLGFVITDINQPSIVSDAAATNGVRDFLPLGLRAGAGFKIADLVMDVDYIYKYYSATEKTESTICVGAERDLSEFNLPVAVRGGINFPSLSGTNVSVGASFRDARTKDQASEKHLARVESEKTSLANMEEELKNLEAQKEQMGNQDNVVVDKKTIADLRSKNSQLNSKKENLLKSIDLINKEENVSKQKESEGMADASSQLQAKIQSDNEELKSLRSDNEVLEQALKEAADKKLVEEIKKKISKDNERIKVLENEISGLEKQYAVNKKQEDARIEKEASAHKKAEEKLKVYTDELAALNAQLESIAAQLKPVEDKQASDGINAKIASLKQKIDNKSKVVKSLDSEEIREPFNYQIDYAMIVSIMDANMLTHRISFSTSFEKPQPRKKQELQSEEPLQEEQPEAASQDTESQE